MAIGAGVEIFRVVVLSSVMFLIGLLVAVPVGYFEIELSRMVGGAGQLLLSRALDGLSIFVACCAFAFKWPANSFCRSMISVLVMNVLSILGSIIMGSFLPSWILMVVGVAVGIVFAGCGVGAALALRRRQAY